MLSKGFILIFNEHMAANFFCLLGGINNVILSSYLILFPLLIDFLCDIVV